MPHASHPKSQCAYSIPTAKGMQSREAEMPKKSKLFKSLFSSGFAAQRVVAPTGSAQNGSKDLQTGPRAAHSYRKASTGGSRVARKAG